MTKMVTIQSSIDIRVTAGLQHQDHSQPAANIPDRLKVAPEWPKHTILIYKGVHNYPAEIKDWVTVQALVKDKILTIGEAFDADTITEQEQVSIDIMTDAKEDFKLDMNTKKTITLNDLACGTK